MVDEGQGLYMCVVGFLMLYGKICMCFRMNDAMLYS